MPSGVYVSGMKSVVKKQSLLSRREAIRMKMRKAVSPNPNQGGGGSACSPTELVKWSV